jgi:hypothetical protein
MFAAPAGAQLETATSGSQRGQRINYGLFSVKFRGTATPRAYRSPRAPVAPLFRRTITVRRPQIVAHGAKLPGSGAPAAAPVPLIYTRPSIFSANRGGTEIVGAMCRNDAFAGNLGAGRRSCVARWDNGQSGNAL